MSTRRRARDPAALVANITSPAYCHAAPAEWTRLHLVGCQALPRPGAVVLFADAGLIALLAATEPAEPAPFRSCRLRLGALARNLGRPERVRDRQATGDERFHRGEQSRLVNAEPGLGGSV